ncbi:MAG: DUF2802 domain-containing protein [Methylococcales bacterium]
MVNMWLIILSVFIAVLSLLLLWLARSHSKLKRDYAFLVAAVQRNSNDVAGLCTAALTVDEHVAVTEQHLNELWDNISELQEQQSSSQTAHAYSNDIQKARSGASINELMQSSGISHDEAALLIRLHGPKALL